MKYFVIAILTTLLAGTSIQAMAQFSPSAIDDQFTVEVKKDNGAIEQSESTTTTSDMKKIKKATFFVAGNCGMCKTRIEKAAKGVAGVSEAEWDMKTKKITVKFDTAQTSEAKIAKAIAAAGHDTKTAKADAKIYSNLPPCCLYDRL